MPSDFEYIATRLLPQIPLFVSGILSTSIPLLEEENTNKMIAPMQAAVQNKKYDEVFKKYAESVEIAANGLPSMDDMKKWPKDDRRPVGAVAAIGILSNACTQVILLLRAIAKTDEIKDNFSEVYSEIWEEWTTEFRREVNGKENLHKANMHILSEQLMSLSKEIMNVQTQI